MSETPSHNLLTVKETAEYLRVPIPAVYFLIQRGQIPAIRIGGRWRIKKSSLDRDILRQDKQGQPTVLVVDDDLGIQELFKTFLKKIGFSRVIVGTAKEAISSLRKQKFDLMFLDLQLPDAPGDQVYVTAKQIDPDLNVIVITGYPDSEMLDRILQISPVTVLKKPLNRQKFASTALPVESALSPESNAYDVLVVDDENALCRIVQRMLSDEIYQVQTSQSVADALQAIEQKPFDAYVMDDKLADGSGLDVAERIRSKGSEAPIILISGYDASSVASRAGKFGIFAYLQKPFSREIICNAMKKAIASTKAHRPD